MQRSLSCIVTPSGVLCITLGSTGQAFTQGASEQWLHITGITQCVTLGKVPTVFITRSAQLWLWPSARVRVLFSVLQASVQHPQPTHFCRLMTIPYLGIWILLQFGYSVIRLSE